MAKAPAKTTPQAQKKIRKKSAASAEHSVETVKKLKIDPGKPAKVLCSELRYEGPLFKVYTDEVKEHTGKVHRRDVIRHNGSVVVLAVDNSRSKRDPYIVIERQYRQAAGEFLYEVPAGKMEAGEDRLAAAKRELLEETGYTARKWRELVRYFASPGFLAEWMQVFVAEDLALGQSAPEDDESFELLRVPLSELLRLIDKGRVRDGKTIIAVLQYARTLRRRK
jgi:ADP-ribose pyrophosphatase